MIYEGRHLFRQFVRRAVKNHLSVPYPHDTAGIAACKIHLMQVYYTGKPSFRGNIMHLFHNNFRRFGIQGSDGFIRQQQLGLLNQCPAYPYPLHLSAGKGIRPFISLILQADLFQQRKGGFSFLPAVFSQ